MPRSSWVKVAVGSVAIICTTTSIAPLAVIIAVQMFEDGLLRGLSGRSLAEIAAAEWVIPPQLRGCRCFVRVREASGRSADSSSLEPDFSRIIAERVLAVNFLGDRERFVGWKIGEQIAF